MLLTQLLLRLRVPIALALLGLVAASAASLRAVRFNFSIRPLIEANPEATAKVARFERELPSEGFHQICLLEWTAPIGRAELDTLRRLSTALEAAPAVSRVVCLATTPVVAHGGGLVPKVVPFPEVVGDRTVLDAARAHPLLLRRLISADGRSACVFITGSGKTDKLGLLTWLEGLVPEQLGPGVKVRFVGGTVTTRGMTHHMRHDMIQCTVLQLIVFAGVLPLFFRSVRGVVLPLVSVIVAVLLSFGALVWYGGALTIIDVAIPGLILIIGLCDAIHLIHRFDEARASGAPHRQAIAEMLRGVGAACVFTSLTTALAFLSLVAADHVTVREFGLKAAVAVVITFFSVITVVSVGLAFWPSRKTRWSGLPRATRLGYGRPKLVAAACALAILWAAAGMSRLVIDSHWLEEFPANDPVALDLAWFEKNFSGIMTLDVELTGDLRRIEAFKAVEALESKMLALDGINKAESYVGWVREALGNPETVDQAALNKGLALLGMLDGAHFPHHVMQRALTKGRLTFYTDDVGSKRYFGYKTLLEHEARRLPEGMRAEVAGYLLMAHQSSTLVVTTLLRSLLLSMTAITVLIGLIYRSLRIALISTLPNLLPIVLTLGLTAWLGMPLRIGIVMIFSVGLGLAVDDSIHLLTRFAQERAADPTAPVRELLLRALHTTGSALILTSLVLMLGVLCFLPSSFQSMRDVGILMSFMVVTALLADLFVLTPLLERFLSPVV